MKKNIRAGKWKQAFAAACIIAVGSTMAYANTSSSAYFQRLQGSVQVSVGNTNIPANALAGTSVTLPGTATITDPNNPPPQTANVAAPLPDPTAISSFSAIVFTSGGNTDGLHSQVKLAMSLASMSMKNSGNMQCKATCGTTTAIGAAYYQAGTLNFYQGTAPKGAVSCGLVSMDWFSCPTGTN